MMVFESDTVFLEFVSGLLSQISKRSWGSRDLGCLPRVEGRGRRCIRCIRIGSSGRSLLRIRYNSGIALVALRLWVRTGTRGSSVVG